MSSLAAFDLDGLDTPPEVGALHGAQHTHLAQESEKLRRGSMVRWSNCKLAAASCQWGKLARRQCTCCKVAAVSLPSSGSPKSLCGPSQLETYRAGVLGNVV